MKSKYYLNLLPLLALPFSANAQVSPSEVNGYLIGAIIASLVLVTAAYLVLVWVAVNDSGEAKDWTIPFTVTFTALSIFLFEFSLVPILAIAGGITLIRHSERTGVGIVAVLVGVWFLLANMFISAGIV